MSEVDVEGASFWLYALIALRLSSMKLACRGMSIALAVSTRISAKYLWLYSSTHCGLVSVPPDSLRTGLPAIHALDASIHTLYILVGHVTQPSGGTKPSTGWIEW